MTGKLITFPYVKGVAEYALGIQEKIIDLRRRRFHISSGPARWSGEKYKKSS